jgi:hypothetical protein
MFTPPRLLAILLALLLAPALGVTAWAATPETQALSDDQVRDRMIADSIGGYSGPCPCPYNMMRNRKPCSTNSAYSKPGGAAPLCYRRDISDAMVRQWRQRQASR